MRDLLVTLIVVGSLPFILRWPRIGIMMYIWVSVMNPHRLSFGFAYDAYRQPYPKLAFDAQDQFGSAEAVDA